MLAWLFPLLTGTRSSRCLLCHGLGKRTVGYRLMLALLLSGSFALAARAGEARHGLAMHGEPAMPEDFVQLPYADPAAPKGGRFVQGVLGTFDSLNPFIVKGIAAPSTRGYVVESLLARGYDEAFTLYGLIASSVETDAQRSYVIFHLNPAARFSDGTTVTAEDVIFSWKLLRDKGRPNYRSYYAKVSKAEVIGERAVRFDLSGSNDRELPLILGLMPVLAEHAVDTDRFEETSLRPLLGSGPYVVTAVDPAKSITLKRNPDYWARDLPINRGLWNFDEIRLDFYREANSYMEAFKRGLYDARTEHEPARWQTAYSFPAARDGLVVKEAYLTGLPKPSNYFVFNTRREVFRDARVREALSYLFDFEWVNRSYFFDLYRRTAGYFDGSELS
jgi:peptide/nickel transport system substrate-binding protein